MKKSRLFFGGAAAMLFVAILFIWYALNHPEGSFPWPLEVTYILYAAYLLLMVALFAVSRAKRRKEEK